MKALRVLTNATRLSSKACAASTGFEIIGEVADGRALVGVEVPAGDHHTAISMPLLNGIEAVRQIRKTAESKLSSLPCTPIRSMQWRRWMPEDPRTS